MGIHLDWEIEAEQSQLHNGGEDPAAAYARRKARLRLLLTVSVFTAILGAVVMLVVLRLREIDSQIEQSLRDTVEAEVATLRIGDYKTFASLQRSASSAWTQQQQNLFNDYQALKLEHNIQLTGHIVAVEIADERGRVHIEEIIDGIPYTHIWFYWHYNDGWFHVPPDYTFWGEVQTTSADSVTVRYQTVDEAVAIALATNVRDWLKTACTGLVCGQVPQINVEVVPSEGLVAGWSVNDPWRLQVPSPYVKGARSDMPFDFDLQLQVANLIADRVVTIASDNLQPNYPADSWYLRQAVINWLVGKFVHIDTNSFLVSSLASIYGEQSVGVLLKLMQPDSNVDILSAVTGVPSLDQTGLDWRDLFTWRLVTEDELSARGNLDGFLSLYDNRDELIRSTAILRYDMFTQAETRVVTLVTPELGENGTVQLRAGVQVGSDGLTRQEEVVFRLVDNVWRRAS